MKSVNEYRPKIAYEWVLTMSDGEEIILTENQYQFYKDHWKDKKVFVGDVEINPSFVTYSKKRAADFVKNLYPCPRCHQSGYDPDDHSFWCKVCDGSGVQLPK